MLKTEINTMLMSEDELGGFLNIFEDAIDTFFKLTHHFSSSSNDPNSLEGQFSFFCSMHYLQTPYTFLSIYHIWKKGYYYESVILLRHLLESFVQMRYFQNKAEDIEGFIKREKRISFETMFNTFAPGLYETFYSQLSNFAHGGLYKDIFRIETESEERIIIMGCRYIEKNATYVINIINVILLGYFKYFNIFFPHSTINLEENRELWDSYNRAISNMQDAVESHKTCHPLSKRWYDLILPLII